MNQTRRRLRGRQPLCGIGVTSRIGRHGEASGLQRAKRGLTARTGTGHFHFNRAHAVLGRLASGVFSGHLGGVRGRLARALETHRAGRRPGDRVALRVGNRDHRVVERRVHMRDARGDVLAFAAADACCFFSHSSLLFPSNAPVTPGAGITCKVILRGDQAPAHDARALTAP